MAVWNRRKVTISDQLPATDYPRLPLLPEINNHHEAFLIFRRTTYLTPQLPQCTYFGRWVVRRASTFLQQATASNRMPFALVEHLFTCHKQQTLRGSIHAVASDSSSTPAASPSPSSTPPVHHAASSTTATATTSTTTTSASSSATPTTFLLLLRFWLGCIVYQQGVEREGFGQYEVANIVAPDRECVKRCRIPVACRHLDCFEVRIHLHIDTYGSERVAQARIRLVPVIVPCTTEPFLSSIVTVSLFSFIKNLS
jgi:hypothetical protein